MSIGELSIILLIFVFAVFCIYKAVKTKPHKLKKEKTFTIIFQKSLPTVEYGEELACFHRKKDLLIPVVVIFGGFVSFVFFAIYYRTPEILVGTLVCIPAISLANDLTRRIYVYEYAIVNKSRLQTQTYWLQDIERLESYNIISSLNFKGISYGYRLVSQENEVLLALSLKEYKNLEDFEGLFINHPATSEYSEIPIK